MRRRVLYLGLPLGALALHYDGLEIAAACISRPEQPGMRRLRSRLAPGALLLERPRLTDPEIVDRLRATAPDLIVSWFWTKRIPEEVIALAPFAFNVHPSLLPRHRGPDPYFWALARGDRVTGVTAHLLTAGYDEGPILSARELVIPEHADAGKLARMLDRPSLALMREIAGRYAGGETFVASAQDDRLATGAPEPTDDDCELRWSRPVSEIVSRIRAASPWPGAFTAYQDRTIVILRAEPASRWPGARPGQAVRDAEGVVIAAADGALRILEAREEEDDGARRGPDVVDLFPGLPILS